MRLISLPVEMSSLENLELPLRIYSIALILELQQCHIYLLSE